MKILSFWLGNSIIAIAPVPFSRLTVLQILTEHLTSVWSELGGDTSLLIDRYKPLLQQIADLFPRLDVPPKTAVFGWDISLMSVSEVQEMFLFQGDGGDLVSPGKLLALHQADKPEEVEQKIPAVGEDIDAWNPPIKSCGSAEIDSLGQLTAALGATDTIALYDRFDLNTINLLIQAYNSAQETPEDRRNKFLAESYQKYKTQNPDIINKALGLDRVAEEFDLQKIFAEKLPETDFNNG